MSPTRQKRKLASIPKADSLHTPSEGALKCAWVVPDRRRWPEDVLSTSDSGSAYAGHDLSWMGCVATPLRTVARAGI